MTHPTQIEGDKQGNKLRRKSGSCSLLSPKTTEKTTKTTEKTTKPKTNRQFPERITATDSNRPTLQSYPLPTDNPRLSLCNRNSRGFAVTVCQIAFHRRTQSQRRLPKTSSPFLRLSRFEVSLRDPEECGSKARQKQQLSQRCQSPINKRVISHLHQCGFHILLTSKGT